MKRRRVEVKHFLGGVMNPPKTVGGNGSRARHGLNPDTNDTKRPVDRPFDFKLEVLPNFFKLVSNAETTTERITCWEQTRNTPKSETTNQACLSEREA